MSTYTIAVAKPAPARLGMIFAGLLGLGIVVFAGHVQASAVHDAAHDTRHATGFPCH